MTTRLTQVSNLAQASSLLYHAYLSSPLYGSDHTPSNSSPDSPPPQPQPPQPVVNWVGFYLQHPGPSRAGAAAGAGAGAAPAPLVVGPYNGRPACISIAPVAGRGVCADAFVNAQGVVVRDVEEYPGHIGGSSVRAQASQPTVHSPQPKTRPQPTAQDLNPVLHHAICPPQPITCNPSATPNHPIVVPPHAPTPRRPSLPHLTPPHPFFPRTTSLLNPLHFMPSLSPCRSHTTPRRAAPADPRSMRRRHPIRDRAAPPGLFWAGHRRAGPRLDSSSHVWAGRSGGIESGGGYPREGV